MPPRIGPKTPVRVYLALWREHAGLTQQQVGDRIEPVVNKATVSRWERAKPGHLSLGVIAAYAEALNRPVVDMYRMPEMGPSLDAMADKLPPDLREQAVNVVTALCEAARMIMRSFLATAIFIGMRATELGAAAPPAPFIERCVLTAISATILSHPILTSVPRGWTLINVLLPEHSGMQSVLVGQLVDPQGRIDTRGEVTVRFPAGDRSGFVRALNVGWDCRHEWEREREAQRAIEARREFEDNDQRLRRCRADHGALIGLSTSALRERCGVWLKINTTTTANNTLCSDIRKIVRCS